MVDFVDASGTPIAANSFFEQDTDTFKIFQFREPEDEDRFIRVSSASGTGTGDYTIDYAKVGCFRVGTELRDQPSLGTPVLYYALGGNDVITSGSERGDTLAGGDGADRIRGGAGEDLLLYHYATRRVVLDLENQERNAGAALGDLTWGIEIVRGSRQDDGL